MQLELMVLLNNQDHEEKHCFLKALTFIGNMPASGQENMN